MHFTSPSITGKCAGPPKTDRRKEAMLKWREQRQKKKEALKKRQPKGFVVKHMNYEAPKYLVGKTAEAKKDEKNRNEAKTERQRPVTRSYLRSQKSTQSEKKPSNENPKSKQGEAKKVTLFPFL